MEYVGMFAQALAASILVAVWSMVRENQDCEKADRNYIRALEDGVDELHAERARLLRLFDRDVSVVIAGSHDSCCPGCGSDSHDMP